ncbi:MAG: AI-2E family transporter [Pseudomonadota bacterium]
MTTSRADSLRWLALLGAAALISVAFVGMIRAFLIALLLAAIAAAMARPVYLKIRTALGGRSMISAGLTLLLLGVAVIAPLMGIVWLAAVQAQGLVDAASTVIDDLRNRSPDDPLPEWLPFRDYIGSRSAEITAKLGELASAAGGFAVSLLGSMTQGTARFFLDLFIFFYALFFFLQMDTPIMRQILGFSGLPEKTQHAFEERIVSISRATIKGTLLIGVAQGTLGGLGFAVAGIDGAAFWGVVMAVLSVIPGLGPLLILSGGVIWLFTQGAVVAATGLAIWGVAVVGTIDNILRPILVGRDTAMHDILILISTLGGLATFGAAGLVLGPVLAGLFVTIWSTLADVAGPNPAADETPRDDAA